MLQTSWLTPYTSIFFFIYKFGSAPSSVVNFQLGLKGNRCQFQQCDIKTMALNWMKMILLQKSTSKGYFKYGFLFFRQLLVHRIAPHQSRLLLRKNLITICGRQRICMDNYRSVVMTL